MTQNTANSMDCTSSNSDIMPRPPSAGNDDTVMSEMAERCLRLETEEDIRASHHAIPLERHVRSLPQSSELHSDYMLHRFHSLPADTSNVSRSTLFRSRSSSSAFDPVSTSTWPALRTQQKPVRMERDSFEKDDAFISDEEDDLQSLFDNPKMRNKLDTNHNDVANIAGLNYQRLMDEEDTDLEVLAHNRVGYRRRMAERTHSGNNFPSDNVIPRSRSESALPVVMPEQLQSRTPMLYTNANPNIRSPRTTPSYLNHTDADFDNITMLSQNSNSTSSTVYLQLPSSSPSRDGATLFSERFFRNSQQQNGNISSRRNSSSSGGSPESKLSNSSNSSTSCRYRKDVTRVKAHSNTVTNVVAKEDSEKAIYDRLPSVVSVPSPHRIHIKRKVNGDDGSDVESSANVSNISHSYILWSDDENQDSPVQQTSATLDVATSSEFTSQVHSNKPPRSPHNFSKLKSVVTKSGKKVSSGHRRTKTPTSNLSPMRIDESTPLSPPKLFSDTAIINSSTPNKPKAKPIMSGIFSDAAALVSPMGSDKLGSFMILPKQRHHASDNSDGNIISPDKQYQQNYNGTKK